MSTMGTQVKVTGYQELDDIRQSVTIEATNADNYRLRVFMLKQWMCSLQQMGADTTAFLDVSEVLKTTFPWNLFPFGGQERPLTDAQQTRLFPAVDEGFRVLDAIYDNCAQLTAEPTAEWEDLPTPAPSDSDISQLEAWPLYQRDPQHTGSADTDHAIQGEEEWRFPIGFAWEARPVIKDGVVYAISPGMRTMMYSLDLETGKQLWATKQLPAIVVDQLYWTPAAGSTPQVLDDEIIVRDLGSRGNSSDTRYAIVIDRASGEITRRIEAGHVDYRTGYAPIAAEGDHIVFPHGVHDIHETPPVAQPFNRLICRQRSTGRKLWQVLTGATLCEPVIAGDTVVTGTMDGSVFCFDLDNGAAGGKSAMGRKRWQFIAGGGVNRSPCVANGRVIFGANDGVISALDEQSGEVVWQFEVESPEHRALKMFSTPLVVDGKVYVGCADESLYCLDETSGKLLWQHQGGDWIRSRPVVSGGSVYICTIDGRLQCVKDGKLAWERTVGRHQSYADLAAADGKILVTTSDLFLWCYDEAGELMWKKSLLESAYDGKHRIWMEQVAGGAYFQSKLTAADGMLFFGTPSRFVYAVDARTGEERWKFELGAAISVAPSYSNGRIFTGQQGGEEYFYCLDAKNGQKVWQQSIGWVWGSCNIAEGKVFVPCIDGYATCLDEETGAIVWRYRTNDSVCTEPTIDGDTVFFGAWDKFMYAFDLHTGRVKWNRHFEHGSDSGSQIAYNGKLYFPCPGSQFRCLNAESGLVEWNLPIDKSNFNVTPALHDEHIFASAMIGRCLGGISVSCNVYRLDINSQEVEWTHPGAGHTAPMVSGDKVYFGSLCSPYVYCVDEVGNEDGTTDCHWTFRMDNRIEESCGAFYDNRLYMLSSGGYVHALR